MKTASATEAKQNFGRILEESLTEPVIIKRSGRISAVLISHSEYERLQRIEDLYWITKAEEGKSSSFLSVEESLNKLTGFIASAGDE